MSLAWISEVNRMLKRQGTHLLYRCICCPCVEWSIAAVCYRSVPCPNPEDACSVDILLSDDWDIPHDDESGGPVGYIQGTGLGLVGVETFNAPYDGSAKITVSLGDLDVVEVATSMTNGDPVELSFDYGGEILQAKQHRLSIVLELTNDGGADPDPVTRETCVIVHDLTLAPALHDVKIVPEACFDLDGGQCIDEEYELVKLKGPFTTLADALYVVDAWDEFIQAYASTCTCNILCGAGDEWGSDSGTLDSGECIDATSLFDEIGGGFHLTENCDTPLDVVWEWALGSGDVSVKLVKGWDGSGYDSVYSEPGAGTSTSLTLPACADATFIICGNADGAYQVSAICSAGDDHVSCCLLDSGSPFYGFEWEYDVDTNAGVPNSTEELEDYLESLGA